jgi:hypothetical protein
MASSPKDCRDYGNFPNKSINVQGTLTYTQPSVFSLRYWLDKFFGQTQAQPEDCRSGGAPVDSGTNGGPQNSRT